MLDHRQAGGLQRLVEEAGHPRIDRDLLHIEPPAEVLDLLDDRIPVDLSTGRERQPALRSPPAERHLVGDLAFLGMLGGVPVPPEQVDDAARLGSAEHHRRHVHALAEVHAHPHLAPFGHLRRLGDRVPVLHLEPTARHIDRTSEVEPGELQPAHGSQLHRLPLSLERLKLQGGTKARVGLPPAAAVAGVVLFVDAVDERLPGVERLLAVEHLLGLRDHLGVDVVRVVAGCRDEHAEPVIPPDGGRLHLRHEPALPLGNLVADPQAGVQAVQRLLRCRLGVHLPLVADDAVVLHTGPLLGVAVRQQGAGHVPGCVHQDLGLVRLVGDDVDAPPDLALPEQVVQGESGHHRGLAVLPADLKQQRPCPVRAVRPPPADAGRQYPHLPRQQRPVLAGVRARQLQPLDEVHHPLDLCPVHHQLGAFEVSLPAFGGLPDPVVANHCSIQHLRHMALDGVAGGADVFRLYQEGQHLQTCELFQSPTLCQPCG